MATLNDLDVCIWRILTSYEKPERIYAWFSFHGAKPSISLEEFRTPPTTNIPVRPLYFSWKLSETKPRFQDQASITYFYDTSEFRFPSC